MNKWIWSQTAFLCLQKWIYSHCVVYWVYVPLGFDLLRVNCQPAQWYKPHLYKWSFKVWKHQNKKYKVSRKLMIHLSKYEQDLYNSHHISFSPRSPFTYIHIKSIMQWVCFPFLILKYHFHWTGKGNQKNRKKILQNRIQMFPAEMLWPHRLFPQKLHPTCVR